MDAVLMHKEIPVVDIVFDEESSVILGIGTIHNSEHLPIGIPEHNGVADRAEFIPGGRNALYRQAGPALRMLLKNWVFLTRKPYCFVATVLVCLINIGSSPKIRISHGGTSISLITRFLMMLVMFCLEPTSARMCWI